MFTALKMMGAGVLYQPRRLLSCIMDLMDPEAPELKVLDRNCDDDLLARFVQCVKEPSPQKLRAATASVEHELCTARLIESSAAHDVAVGMGKGVAKFLGYPTNVVETSQSGIPQMQVVGGQAVAVQPAAGHMAGGQSAGGYVASGQSAGGYVAGGQSAGAALSPRPGEKTVSSGASASHSQAQVQSMLQQKQSQSAAVAAANSARAGSTPTKNASVPTVQSQPQQIGMTNSAKGFLGWLLVAAAILAFFWYASTGA